MEGAVDDADLALAIANSLRDVQQQRQRQSNRETESDGPHRVDGDAQNLELELSRAVEESYWQAKSHRQESNDAELASDLDAIEALEESEARKRQRVSSEDAELASDVAAIDRMAETEREEVQLLALQEVSESFSARRGLERAEGSWDCPACTYHNRPYAAKCEACGDAPPHTVLAFADLPSQTRFGVELELLVPRGDRDGLTHPWVARQLTALGVPTYFVGYNHETSDKWKIVRDASLQSSADDLCFEIVSPVLMGESGLESVRTMLESIRQIGIDINSSCGFHVHVDAEEGPMASLVGLKRLVNCFVSLEGAFDCLVARDASRQAQNRRANRNRYCRSNALAFGPLSRKQRWNRINGAQSVAELVSMANPNDDRYRKLNLTNLTKLDRPSTCEFRQHGGVSELLVAEAWIRLVLRFCHITARDSTIANGCLLMQGATLNSELETLLRVADCPGVEHFYLIDRSLFPLMEKSSRGVREREWKCRCGRRFRDCRALAQHSRDTGHQPM
ncbi:hypothetical protein ACHAWF_007300 [Thalassiosira exigua]